MHSYNNHYILQTTPEDWWYTIICTIATGVDRALEESHNDPSIDQKFRDFFVGHEDKRALTVFVPPVPLHDQDYPSIFSEFTEQIRANVKVPYFAETVRADFSTSTSTHVMESEISLMSTMKNYFTYKVHYRCGIPQIEMMGTEEDWEKLKDKFIKLRGILAPLDVYFVGFKEWWDEVEYILQRLIDTYKGEPDLDWWSHIFSKVKPWSSGPAPDRYLTGWFISDFLNGKRVEKFDELPSGLTTCPLILEGAGYPTPVNATLVAGIAGIQVDDSHEPVRHSSRLEKLLRAVKNSIRDHRSSKSNLKVPKVRALHGWALFLDEAGVSRGKEGYDHDHQSKNLEEQKLELQYTAQW